MYEYPTSSCLLSKSGVQSLATGTQTDIVWQTEDRDEGGWFDAQSNTLIIIPHSMAAVQLQAGIRYDASATGDRWVELRKHDDTYQRGLAAFLAPSPAGSFKARVNLTTPPIQVSSGDRFKVMAWHANGSNLNVENAGETYFSATKVDSLHGAMVTLQTAVFSVAGGAALDYVEWDTEVYDTGNFWAATSPTILFFSDDTVKYGRFYAGVRWAPATADTFLNIDKNGSSVPAGGALEYEASEGGNRVRQSLVSEVIPISSGDFFECQVRHDAAGNVNIENHEQSYFAFEVVDDG